MPAERRSFTARPVKTERTHEENQERAYIAASRRSDRSLEARIESARRASEIHKKRTGRALRVTEQDVINEEMYEEEDDDLPTQYQRLNAHLHTTSVMFNKKLHDYIATQHGVRNMFMSQYQTPSYPQYGAQFSPTAATTAFPQPNNWMNPAMLPPQQQQPQQQQQNFRQSPYQIPQRLNNHGRSLSIQLPHQPAVFDPASQSAPGGITTPQDSLNRRLSLPPSAFNQQAQAVTDGRPAMSRATTAQSASPAAPSSISGESGQGTPQLQDADTPYSFPYSPAGMPFTSQALNANPLTLSLPPESQQFVGSALDPNDPRTAIFMAGSENLPQPFAPTYTYNPNLAGKLAQSSTAENVTLAPASGVKTENIDTPSTSIPASISDGFFNNEAFLTPGNGDYNAFFDFQSSDFTQTADDQGDGSSFVNWD